MIKRTFDIVARIEQGNIPYCFQVVQNDKDVYALHIRITEGDKEIDYTQVSSATITFALANGSVVQSDPERVAISSGGITYEMGTTEISCPGKVLASIQLFGSSGERLTTARFQFEVVADLITPGAVQSESRFPLLQQLVADVEQLKQDIVDLQIPDNSIMDVKLSDAAGQIKQRFASHLADYASHVAEYANHGNLKNKIINGDFVINQRRASTKAQPIGVYGYDRWKGHANGLEQVIEALPAGTYTLSWQGGGIGTFGGITGESPITATVPAGNWSVVVPATATKVQLEEGNYATPFEQRPIGLELMLCQRYCLYIGVDDGTRAWAVQPNVLYFNIPLPTTMRIVPSLESGSLIVRPIDLSSTETGFTFSFLSTPRSNTLTIRATKTAHGLSDAMLYLTNNPVFSAEL